MFNEVTVTYIDRCQISTAGMCHLLEGRCVNVYPDINEYLLSSEVQQHRKNEVIILVPRKELTYIDRDALMLRNLIASHHQRLIIFGDSSHLNVGYMSALIKPDMFIEKKRSCLEVKQDIENFLMSEFYHSRRIDDSHYADCDRLTKKEFCFLKKFLTFNDIYQCSVKMGISYKTASAHLCNILRKYGIKNKLHLISML